MARSKIYKPSKIYPPRRQRSPPRRMMCRRAPVPTNPPPESSESSSHLDDSELEQSSNCPDDLVDLRSESLSSDVSDTDPNVKWVFNKELGLILHEVDKCDKCEDFGLHFCAAKLRLHSSFNEARESYKEAVLGGIQSRVDRLQTQRDEVMEKIAALRRDVADAQEVLRKGRDRGCQGTVHDDTEDHHHLPHSSPCSSPKCKYARHTRTPSPQPMRVPKSPSIVALSSPTIPAASQANPFCDEDVWIVSPPASHF
ncbi:hypothetical protein BJV77DRAFT_1029012 [Russula vinacea]|nr:hypothetical protein BJV77DRAFT_1029012 [Russula vinacea]